MVYDWKTGFVTWRDYDCKYRALLENSLLRVVVVFNFGVHADAWRSSYGQGIYTGQNATHGRSKFHT